MGLNAIDLLVIAAVLVFAWSGWRQGFVAALLSFIGFITGGLFGSFIAPWLLESMHITGATGLIVTVLLVLGLAVAGQVVASLLGRQLREWITIDQLRIVDNLGGAVLNVIALAVIGWILAATAAALPSSSVAAQVRSSTLLTSLDDVVPSPARDFVSNLRGLVDDSGLPQLFDSFGVLPPPPVAAPTSGLANTAAVRSSLQSVVLIEGSAPSCGSGFTGSGFVIAQDRVLTNAHVVAGVPNPRVHVLNRRRVFQAKTVYFDPRVDIAVLSVPGLDLTPLKLAGNAKRGDDAVIAGYPGGGPMIASAARVRGKISGNIARGTDIYGRPGVEREIFALRGIARPGNSGGPMLAPNGKVSGVVFAQAQADPETAYALTAEQVQPAVSAGIAATAGVSTGACPKE